MILLDTHTFLWFLNDDPKLPAATKDLIETAQNVFVSIGSFWEIAIKESLGKLTIPASVSELISDCESNRMTLLPVKAAHLDLLKDLPKIHGNPFDRLLICQAKAENLTLITVDENIKKYDVKTLWTP